VCNTCLRRGRQTRDTRPTHATRPLPSPFSIALRRVFVFVRVWSPAVDSMWSALRDGSCTLTYESLRQPPLLALRSICSCTSLYILPQITPHALFSNDRVDMVLTGVTAGACPRSSRLLSPPGPYTMCSSRLPPSPRSLIIVHKRSSIVRYSSCPGKSGRLSVAVRVQLSLYVSSTTVAPASRCPAHAPSSPHRAAWPPCAKCPSLPSQHSTQIDATAPS